MSEVLGILLDNARILGRGTVRIVVRDLDGALVFDVSDEGTAAGELARPFDRGRTWGRTGSGRRPVSRPGPGRLALSSRSRQSRGMRTAKWFGGAVWIGSWYLMYLEITRWHHVKPSLAFNADPVPGTGLRPRPGQPLILLYLACVAAPLVVVAGVVTQIRARRAAITSRRPQRPARARPGPSAS